MTNRKLPAAVLIDRLLIVVLLALLAGCAGSAAPAQLANPHNPLGFSPRDLPAIPQDSPLGRRASVLQDDALSGASAFLQSSGASDNGNELLVVSDPGGLEWGIWRYDVGDAVLQSMFFSLNVSGGNQAWIAIANYATQRWEFRGPYPTTPGLKGFTSLNFGNYVSPGGNMYALALGYDGTDVTVSSLTVTVDVEQTVFGISGTVTNSNGGAPVPGVSVTLTPGGQQAMTGPTGTYSFSGLAAGNYTLTPTFNDWTFAPADRDVTLGPDSMNQDFSGTEPDIPVTYENTMKPLFDTYCVECHGPDLQREDVRLDTYANIMVNDGDIAELAVELVQDESMPNEDDGATLFPSDAERDLWVEWELDGFLED